MKHWIYNDNLKRFFYYGYPNASSGKNVFFFTKAAKYGPDAQNYWWKFDIHQVKKWIVLSA